MKSVTPDVLDRMWQEWFAHNFIRWFGGRYFRHHNEDCTCNISTEFVDWINPSLLDGAKIVDDCCDGKSLTGCADTCVVKAKNGTLLNFGCTHLYGTTETDRSLCTWPEECWGNEADPDYERKKCELTCRVDVDGIMKCLANNNPKMEWQPSNKRCCASCGSERSLDCGNYKKSCCDECEIKHIIPTLYRWASYEGLCPPLFLNPIFIPNLPAKCAIPVPPQTCGVYHPALVLAVEAECPDSNGDGKKETVQFDIYLHGGAQANSCLGPLDSQGWPLGGSDDLSPRKKLGPVCQINSGIAMTTKQVTDTLDNICSMDFGKAQDKSCNCGAFFISALRLFTGMEVEALKGEACDFRDTDCEEWAWELSKNPCEGSSQVSPTLTTMPTDISTACLVPPTCAQSCSSCASCPLDSLTCNHGFCLDSYPADARERLITAIKSKDTPGAMGLLSEMFKLSPEQSQRCSADFTSSGVGLGYGFKAPAMPAGTDPEDKCFSQLSSTEQEYWRKEYERRKNCGIWIKVAGE